MERLKSLYCPKSLLLFCFNEQFNTNLFYRYREIDVTWSLTVLKINRDDVFPLN